MVHFHTNFLSGQLPEARQLFHLTPNFCNTSIEDVSVEHWFHARISFG